MSVVAFIRAFVLTVLRLIEKVFCFWRKKRDNGARLPTRLDRNFINPRSETSQVSWDSWGDEEVPEIVVGSRKPETVEDHIKAYRESLQEARRQQSENETIGADPNPDSNPHALDILAEIEPDVRKARKLYVGPKSREQQQQQSISNRLSVQNTDDNVFMNDELADWDQLDENGWQVEDNNLTDALREHRKKHQRTKLNS